MINKKILSALLVCFFFGQPMLLPGFAAETEPAEAFTLRQTIEAAVKANIGLQSSQEGTRAALATQKIEKTKFLPTLSVAYQYSEDDEASSLGGIALGAKSAYTFSSRFVQPVFTGFANLNRYKIADLGLDAAKINETRVHQDVIFQAKNVYFSLLKAQKLLSIAEQTVKQISAQKNVAKNFYEVGMTPLNDLLQSEVELANARQELIVAKNNLQNAESDFNILLRRPLNTPVVVEDILEYTPFEPSLEQCVSDAEKKRPELKIADLETEIAEREVKLARKDYFPSINLEGSYFKSGTEWDVDGGDGIYDPSGWNILATASWNFWEWGRTAQGVREKLARRSQAQLKKKEVLDNIHLEVKNAYLRTQEAEKAILAVEKAIEQAKENFRINEERYKEQMATSTDVLDAQTLLSRTMTNYYSALYAFKISKAALYRAIGQEIME